MKRALLVAGSLLVSFALAEIALRVHYSLSWTGSLEELHRRPSLPAAGRSVSLGRILRPSLHPRLVYELKPDLDVRFGGEHLRTSAAGWREAAVSRDKPPHTVRIVGIGDSVMFGWRVAEEDRYLDLLEARLRTTWPAIEWQTVVTAVPGYNLVMELESLERYGDAYDPDLVIYGWHPNDFNLPNFLLPKKDVWAPVSFLAEYLAGRGARSPRLEQTQRLLSSPTNGENTADPFADLHGRAAFERGFERLRDYVERRSIPVVVLGALDASVESVSGIRLPEELIYVDPRPRAAAVPADQLSFRRDPHPNERGHRVLADALFEELETAGVWHDLRKKHGEIEPENEP